MGNNCKETITFKEGLMKLKAQLSEKDIPECEEINQKGESKEWQIIERNRRLGLLKEDKFILNFTEKPGFSINNFFRGRYNFSRTERPQSNMLMYKSIDPCFIKSLINLSIIMGLSEPLSEDTIFYRGCIDVEKNGVNGLVTITSDYKIAEKYSEGTILAITVPKGTRLLKIADAVPYDSRTEEMDKEFLLPPCKAVITNESENVKNLIVTPLDLLEQFYKAMCNIPPEYENEHFDYLGGILFNRNVSLYDKAKRMLYNHLLERLKRENQIEMEKKDIKVYSLTGKQVFKI